MGIPAWYHFSRPGIWLMTHCFSWIYVPVHLGKCSLFFLHKQKGNVWESGFSYLSVPAGSRERLQNRSQERLLGKRTVHQRFETILSPSAWILLGYFSQELKLLKTCLWLLKDAPCTKIFKPRPARCQPNLSSLLTCLPLVSPCTPSCPMTEQPL
jgi:hypothetical protein